MSPDARLGSVRRCRRAADNDRAVLTDVEGVPRIALRADGPTGLHAVGADGSPLFVASAVRVGLGGTRDQGTHSQDMIDVGLELIQTGGQSPMGTLGLLGLLVVALVSPGAYRMVRTAA